MTSSLSSDTAAADAAARTAHQQRIMRGWAGALSLWRLCGQGKCRRARACRGDARACFPRHYPLLPDGVRGWFECLLVAREDGMPFEEVIAELERLPGADALRAWNEAVARSLTPPPPPSRAGLPAQ